MSRRLMITVDVEAQPKRATEDHVNRLIHGRFPGARPGGVDEMMSIADRHDVRLVMFFDFVESHYYGDSITEAARLIHECGHDLQLHAHPRYFPKRFWLGRALEQTSNLDGFTYRHADAVIDDLCRQHFAITGRPALAFRGGGYRYNAEVLRALVEHGVRLDSSYIATRDNQPFKLGPLPQFEWARGPLELPVSTAPLEGRSLREFNFNHDRFTDAQTMFDFLDAFYAEMGDDAVAVMVMHSWSLSRKEEDDTYGPPRDELAERFEQFLAGLRGNVDVVTAPQVLDLHDHGELPVARTVSIVRRRTPVLQRTDRLGAGAGGGADPACALCGTVKSEFGDDDRGGRRCPTCGSIERQRTLPIIYDQFLRAEFPLEDKRVLAIGPSKAEMLFFEQRGIDSVVRVDIHPDERPDLLLDVCAMPEIPDESFDAIVASFILPCAYDLDGALSEFHRILRPGGRLLTGDPLRVGWETTEYDEDVSTQWYGREAYEKYKVGKFRTLGDIGLLRKLQEHFVPKTFYARDPITDKVFIWVASERPDPLTKERVRAMREAEEALARSGGAA